MACRDRLADLLAATANNTTARTTTTHSAQSSSAPQTDPWRVSDIGEFLEEVNVVRGQLILLDERVDRLEHKHADLLVALTREAQQTLAADASELVIDINTHASRIRASLRAMGDENKEFERISAQELNDEVDGTPADVRIRNSQHAALARKFAATMLRFAEIRDTTATRRQQLASRMKELGLSLTDIRTSPDAQDRSTLVDQQCVRLEAEAALEDVQERHRQLAALERDMTDLHAMFVDLSLLVEEQAEILDRIDLNVDRAAVYVEKGREELKQAKKLKSSIRKKAIGIGAIVVVAVAAAVTAPLRVFM